MGGGSRITWDDRQKLLPIFASSHIRAILHFQLHVPWQDVSDFQN